MCPRRALLEEEARKPHLEWDALSGQTQWGGKGLDMVGEYSQAHEKQARGKQPLPAQALLETKGEMVGLKFPTRCRGLWRADQLLLIHSFHLKKHQFWLDEMRTWGIPSRSGQRNHGLTVLVGRSAVGQSSRWEPSSVGSGCSGWVCSGGQPHWDPRAMF